MKRLAGIVVLVSCLVSCGSNSDDEGAAATEAATSPPVSAAPATPVATAPPADTDPATTEAPTTEAPTTTQKTLSRDAVLASKRCIDALTYIELGAFAAKYGETDDLSAAQDTCKEAMTQIEVDGLPIGNRLNVLISERNLAAAFLVLKIVSADATADVDAATFDNEAIQWGRDAGAELASAS